MWIIWVLIMAILWQDNFNSATPLTDNYINVTGVALQAGTGPDSSQCVDVTSGGGSLTKSSLSHTAAIGGYAEADFYLTDTDWGTVFEVGATDYTWWFFSLELSEDGDYTIELFHNLGPDGDMVADFWPLNQWVHVRTEWKLSTYSGGTWQSDGFIRIYLDSVLVWSLTDSEFVRHYNDGSHTDWTAVRIGPHDRVDNLEIGTLEEAQDIGPPIIGTTVRMRAPSLPGTHYWASVGLSDPATYYGGYKQPRIVSFGNPIRALTDLSGQWRSSDLTIVAADTDRHVRHIVSSAIRLLGTSVVMRAISNTGRVAQQTPRVLFRGTLSSYRPLGNLRMELRFGDKLSEYARASGTEEKTIPMRTINNTDFPNAPVDSLKRPVPIIYGDKRDQNDLVTAKGICSLIYTGIRSISGTNYHEWVVAGHAVRSITGLYLSWTDGDTPHVSRITSFGTNWFMPGQTGWSGISATLYRDFNSRRYTVVYGRVGVADPDGAARASGYETNSTEKVLTCNVQGIEDASDGTGNLVTGSFEQFLHFFINWGIQDYRSGTWLDIPLYEAGWCQVNAQSWLDAQAASVTRIGGNGYTGAAYIGKEAINFRDAIELWCRSLDCRLGLNEYFQWTVVLLPTTVNVSTLESFVDRTDILTGTLNIDPKFDERITRVQAFAGEVIRDDGEWTGSDYLGTETYNDTAAEELFGEISAELQLPYVTATSAGVLSSTAEDVARRYVALRSAATVNIVTFETDLCGLRADLGDIIRVTHFAGVGSSGWVDQLVQVDYLEINVDQRKMTISGLDVTHVYAAGWLDRIGYTTYAYSAPTGGNVMLIGKTLGAADQFGIAGATCYYKVVAVFDGQESRPLIVGPVVTYSNMLCTYVTWATYPTAAQIGPDGVSRTPDNMRIYRSSTPDFSADVQQCFLTDYPVPEAPDNINAGNNAGSGTTYYYKMQQWYRLAGVGPVTDIVTIESGSPPDTWVDAREDAIIDSVGVSAGYELITWGRTAGAPNRLERGSGGNYHDTGSTDYKSAPPARPAGDDLPISTISFYDKWPGRTGANTPWTTIVA